MSDKHEQAVKDVANFVHFKESDIRMVLDYSTSESMSSIVYAVNQREAVLKLREVMEHAADVIPDDCTDMLHEIEAALERWK